MRWFVVEVVARRSGEAQEIQVEARNAQEAERKARAEFPRFRRYEVAARPVRPFNRLAAPPAPFVAKARAAWADELFERRPGVVKVSFG